jgi:hypothetical protein
MNLTEKVAALRPGKTFVYQEETLESIQFIDEDVAPVTQEELDKESPRLEQEYEIARIKQLRQAAYQAESDPIFFQAQREAGTRIDDWHAKIAEIEARYPLPTGS